MIPTQGDQLQQQQQAAYNSYDTWQQQGPVAQYPQQQQQYQQHYYDQQQQPYYQQGPAQPQLYYQDGVGYSTQGPAPAYQDSGGAAAAMLQPSLAAPGPTPLMPVQPGLQMDQPEAQQAPNQPLLPLPPVQPAPPAQTSILSRIAGFFLRGGQAQEAGADGAGAGPGLEGLGQQGDDRDPDELVTLSYTRAFKIYEPQPQLEQQLLLQFDQGPLGIPTPLPQRQAVLQLKRMPKEELGLYTEQRPSLGLHSLKKMEQRVVKSTVLDEAMLQALSSQSEEVAEAAAAGQLSSEQHQAAQQELVVGALPRLVEEEEEEGQQGPLRPAPAQPMLAAPALPLGPNAFSHQGGLPQPMLRHSALPDVPRMTDPQQVWQALSYHQEGLTQIGAWDPNHPNHLQLQLVMAALQQMSAGGPLPAVGMDGMPLPPIELTAAQPSPFLDEDRLLTYIADPVKRRKERPARRYDQDKEATRIIVRPPILDIASATEGLCLSNHDLLQCNRTYRLDIELNRLEFLVHSSMTQEELLAARLLAAFKEFKRRESVGLASFYANKLAGLEDALLAAREKLFSLSEQAALAAAAGVAAASVMAAGQAAGDGGAGLADAAVAVAQGKTTNDELKAALDGASRLEQEVAETRQLKEEEEQLMLRAVEVMQWLYSQIQSERATHGWWRTQLELTVQARPPEEAQWAMGSCVPRDRLDAQLLVADEEAISGLPPPPMAFPPPPAMDDLPQGGFRPRRVETMCASHRALVAQLTNRLNDLKGRPSADLEDPIIRQLQDQLTALGPAPRRLAPSHPEERAYALEAAIQRVRAGEVGVPRYPKLLPILTVLPQDACQAQLDQAGSGQQVALAEVGSGSQAAGSHCRPGLSCRAQHGKQRYYTRLYLNGQYVDSCQPVSLGSDFTAQFKDLFSIQVARWPESITIEVYEVSPVRDTLLATLYVAVPGLSGTPHVDPRALAYQFTSLVPYPCRGPWPLSPPGSPGRGGLGPADEPSMIYPAGVVYVRCGWVSQAAPAGARMDDVQATMHVTNNPLSDVHHDIEAAQAVMPPVPQITVDRLLRRAAERIGGKVNRQQVMKWIHQHMVDPNDPRNAPLMELMRAQEATNSAGMGDLFRLDVFPDIAIPASRHQGKRSSFLARRWASGPFRDPEHSVLKGVRHVRIPAVLSARDTEDMEHLYLDALALVELVPGGSGPAIARAMIARQERATRMQIGLELSQGIEEREARIKNYALRIRAAANRIAGGKQAGRHYKTDDVVHDLPLPEFKVDLSTLSRMVAPRRPLKRTRKTVKSMQTSVPPDTELMITIHRAANLPQRRGSGTAAAKVQRRGRDVDRPSDQQASGPAGPGGDVQAFVEVRFRGLSCRTVSAGTDYPTFNEMMTIPVFGTEEEPSSATLYENSDVVTINVFDEIINDRVGEPRVLRSNKEDAISDPVRYPERERRFLGCVRIPLSAVYQLQVLEGTFKLEAPPVLLGYSQRSERPPTLSMYLSLKPRLAPPAELPEHLLSGEPEDITLHARAWLQELQQLSQCRGRVLRVMAVDPEGTSLLISRFVAPTRLPPVVEAAAIAGPGAVPAPVMTDAAGVDGEGRGEGRDVDWGRERRRMDKDREEALSGPKKPLVCHTEEVMLKAARFVSLIPYLEDSALQKRRVDVWSSSAEALHLAAGDAEEHAHLLAGYFMELGQQAFVVLGASTYGARSCFVLTTGKAEFGRLLPEANELYNWHELQLRLWNPLSGGVTSIKDISGELREVGVVYNHSNIWANVQVSGAPWEMRWQLNDPRDWQPFFGLQLPPRELGTIQEPVMYEERPDVFYEQLETRIEETARDALQKARSLGAFVTKPDNRISRVLKSLLRGVPAAVNNISQASLAASLVLADALQGSGGNGSAAVLPPLGNLLNERHRAITALQDAHNERVLREARADWVQGHILALPFSDKYTEAVAEAVLNTGLHRIADERAKYSVAALVERGGAAFCCCCWIYIAATR